MQKFIIQIFTAAMLLLALDLPWLMVSSPFVGKMIQGIQGSPLRFRYAPAIVVYVALGYLILQTKTVKDAFLAGAATYAVYDFTNLATLEKYSAAFAIVDSLWGGVLFAIAKTILNMNIIPGF